MSRGITRRDLERAAKRAGYAFSLGFGSRLALASDDGVTRAVFAGDDARESCMLFLRASRAIRETPGKHGS
jgi:hypothetical protein